MVGGKIGRVENARLQLRNMNYFFGSMQRAGRFRDEPALSQCFDCPLKLLVFLASLVWAQSLRSQFVTNCIVNWLLCHICPILFLCKYRWKNVEITGAQGTLIMSDMSCIKWLWKPHSEQASASGSDEIPRHRSPDAVPRSWATRLNSARLHFHL